MTSDDIAGARRGPGSYILAIAVGLVFAGKLMVAASSGLAKDEGYYALWSVHPAAGYLDHPPLVAWFIAAGRLVLGDTTLGVRLGAVLAGLLTTIALYRIGCLLFDRATGRLAALWYVLTIATGLDFIITPDAPLVLFWTLAVWAVAEFTNSRNPWWWLAVGAAAGLGVESKYTTLLLGLGLLLLLVSSRERRRWLALPHLWAGGALAILLVLPNLIWNAQHGWATVLFQGRRIGDTLTAANLPEIIAAQLLLVGPGIVAFAIAAIAAFVLGRGREARAALAVPVLTTLPAWLYFFSHSLHARVEANWLLPTVPMLVLLAAFAAMRLWRRGGFLVGMAIVGQTLFGALALATVYAQILFQPFAAPDIDRTRELRGWTQLQAEVSGLARSSGAAWIATLGDYPLTGQLATYGRFARDSLPVQPLGEPVRYAFLPPLPASVLAQPALYIATMPGDAVPELPSGLFATAQPLGVVARRQGDDVIERYAVFRVSGLAQGFIGSPTTPVQEPTP